MPTRTREVSGWFTPEQASAIAGALISGDEETVDRLLKDAVENPPDIDRPEPNQQAGDSRFKCGECTSSGGQAIRSCVKEVLIRTNEGELRWAPVGVSIQECDDNLALTAYCVALEVGRRFRNFGRRIRRIFF